MNNLDLTEVPMPAFQQVYDLLKANYKPSRFEDRNDNIWGYDYSRRITNHSLDQLRKFCKAYVSRFEDKSGEGFSFGRDLVIIR